MIKNDSLKREIRILKLPQRQTLNKFWLTCSQSHHLSSNNKQHIHRATLVQRQVAQPGLMTRSLHHRGFCTCAKSLPELLDSKGCRILGYLRKQKRKPKRLKIKTSLIGRLPHLLTFIEYESLWHETSHRKELNAQTELPQFVHVAASAPYHFQNQKVYYADNIIFILYYLLFMKLV